MAAGMVQCSFKLAVAHRNLFSSGISVIITVNFGFKALLAVSFSSASSFGGRSNENTVG
jgi:hypothetical protein